MVLWQALEGNHVSKGTVLTQQSIPKSEGEPEQDIAFTSWVRSLAPSAAYKINSFV